jgi:hypothetical protein
VELPAEQELGEHLALLQRYLSDEVAPLVFCEALEALLAHPAVLIAAEVRTWVAAQYRGTAPLPVSDYLFHVARKLHVVGELGLIPADVMRAWLQQLEPVLLEQCPDADRDSLAEDFAHLDDSSTALANPVQLVHRAGSGEAVRASAVRAEAPRIALTRAETAVRAPAPMAAPAVQAGAALPEKVVHGLRRLNLLLDRLESEAPLAAVAGGAADGGGSPAPSAEREALLARVLAAAAASAAEPQELESSLDRLRRHGVNTGTRSVLRLLGQSLPDWTPPATAAAPAAPPHEAVTAMRQVVALGRDRADTSRRFSELVQAACEEFNGGSLGRTVTMLDLADRMAADENVDPVAARAARSSAWNHLDADRLRAFAESADKHHLLRSVLQFFTDLAPAYLLDRLSGEPRRDRRRLLLSLLTVHGAPARVEALSRLQATSTGATWADWYVERNLLHLLRRIPPPADTPLEPELEVLARLSQPGAPVAVIKEAIAVLAQHRHPRAEQTLIARVAELENGLLGVKPLPYEAGELVGILDRVLTLLARAASPAARRCVVDHGLRRAAQLGDTVARLAELGGQDLAGEPELVARLVKTLRDELPARVFGVTVSMRRRSDAASHLIAALSGTRAPAVREVLRDVVARYPDEPLAAEAQRALDRVGDEAAATVPPAPAPAPASPRPPSAAVAANVAAAADTAAAVVRGEPAAPAAAPVSLAGDLGVFGLPTLLQNLADSEVTGTLTLTGADGGTVATLEFARGAVAEAQTGRLRGTTALYALLERERVQRFAFVNAAAAPGTPAPAGAHAVLPLLMEGMRRLDEYQRAAAVAPDDARLAPGEVRPNRIDDEPDLEMMRTVWRRAVGGATPREIEAETALDPYRVRRLFEHWLEEGSLKVVR